jgi:hypothetical protein
VDRKSTPAIPEAIAHLQHQLDQFRSTRPHHSKLPEPLWQAAPAAGGPGPFLSTLPDARIINYLRNAGILIPSWILFVLPD